jgi:hypothetical protein
MFGAPPPSCLHGPDAIDRVRAGDAAELLRGVTKSGSNRSQAFPRQEVNRSDCDFHSKHFKTSSFTLNKI